MKKIGNYLLQDQILARGFSSIVHKGRDTLSQNQVAIKRIDESVLDSLHKKKMLSNELNIQWELSSHPNIVQIKAQFYEEDSIYIITELCHYGDLKSKIKEKGKLVEAKAVSYMLDIIKGFEVMVKHGIVHRDIKSANILVAKSGIKIGDFGYASKVSQNASDKKENSGHELGSPSYMAPQVLENGKKSSHLSDIWSIGVVFYQMITGKLPFLAKCKETLIKVIQHTGIRALIPEDLSLKSKEFILRTLKKDPAKRIKPEELIEFQFDDQILFKIQQHRARKRQEERIREEEKLVQFKKQGQVKCANKSNLKSEVIKQVNPQKIRIKQQKPGVEISYKQFDSNQHHGKAYLDPKDIHIERTRRKNVDKTARTNTTDRCHQNQMAESTVRVVMLERTGTENQSELTYEHKGNKHEQDYEKVKNHKKSYHQKNHQHQHQQQTHQLKKEQIIDILLGQIDTVRFLSRILHKIEQIHHLNFGQHTCHDWPNDKKPSQKDVNQVSIEKQIQKPNINTQPEIYIQVKLYMLDKVQEIEKLEFLTEHQAMKFLHSEDFHQINLILDTYRDKLDFQNLNNHKWKGLTALQRQLDQQILLIYKKIKSLISYYQSHHQHRDSNQMRKLTHKIQALKYMMVLRYDYLAIEKEDVFLDGKKNQEGSKHYQSCAQIQTIMNEKHGQSHHSTKDFEENMVQLKKLEQRLHTIRLI